MPRSQESNEPVVTPAAQRVLATPGQPLAPEPRGVFEERFGHDFSRVRVHADADAHESARSLGAAAYTVGRHVVMGRSRPLDTPEGTRSLAHELAHVVQQERGGPTAGDKGHGRMLERGADAAASAFAAGPGPIEVAGASAPGLAREPLLDLGDPEPRSLRETLVVNDSFTDAALDREITLIEQWLERNPSDLRGGPLFLELDRLREVRTQRERRRKAASPEARRDRTIKHFGDMPEEKLRKQYQRTLEAYADDPSWQEKYDLETLQGIVEGRFPDASWNDRRLARELVSSKKWRWHETGQLETLKAKIQGWTADEQALARDLLWQWLELRRQRVSKKDAREQIIKLLRDHYEQWLRAVDKERSKRCGKEGFFERQHSRGNADDPCKSWFGTADEPREPSALIELERLMRVRSDEDSVPYLAVEDFVAEFRRRTNPKELKAAADAQEMLSGFAMAGRAGPMPPPGLNLARIAPIKPPPEPAPAPVATKAVVEPPKPVVTAHAEPGNVTLNTVKPPVVDVKRPIQPAPPAPAPVNEPTPTVTTGKRIKVTVPARDPGTAPKPPKPQPTKKDPPTAIPKSGPQPPESHGDVLEQPGVNVTPTPGGGQQTVKTQIGNWTHKHAEVLQTNPDVLARIAKETGKTGTKAIFDKELPAGLIPEYQIKHPDVGAGKPRPQRIDRLWRSGETIYEIKPNTKSAAKGEGQAQTYANWMNEYEPLPGGRKWKTEVVQYDQAAMQKFLEGIGVLPTDPPPAPPPKKP